MPSIKIAAALLFSALAGCGARDDVPIDVASSPVEEEKPAPVPEPDPIQCVAGERYVCDCNNGNRGNKICAWTGDAFSECMLCGSGAEYIEDTGIPCDVTAPCPTMVGCVGLVCYSKTCHLATALPATILDDATPNDCRQTMCDGFGNEVEVSDPGDCAGACDSSGACVP